MFLFFSYIYRSIPGSSAAQYEASIRKLYTVSTVQVSALKEDLCIILIDMLIDVLLLLDFMSCNNEDPLENSATSFTEVNILDCLTVRNCCLESDDITMQVIGNCQESVLRLYND